MFYLTVKYLMMLQKYSFKYPTTQWACCTKFMGWQMKIQNCSAEMKTLREVLE